MRKQMATFPSQPLAYMAVLIVGIVVAMVLAYQKVKINMVILMVGLAGLIGGVMASYSGNASLGPLPYTMKEFGSPFIATCVFFTACVVTAYLMENVGSGG